MAILDDIRSFLSGGKTVSPVPKQQPQQATTFGNNLIRQVSNALPPLQAYNSIVDSVPRIQNAISNFAVNNPRAANLVLKTEPAYNAVQNTVRSIPANPVNLQPVRDYVATSGFKTKYPLLNKIANAPMNIATNVGTGIVEGVANAPAQMVHNAYRFPQAKTPQEALGRAAGIVEPMLSMATPRQIPELVKKASAQPVFLNGKQKLLGALKEGASTGAQFGGLFGGLQGIQENTDSNNVLEQVINAGPSAVVAAAVGGVIGAGTAGAGQIVKSTSDSIQGEARVSARNMAEKIVTTKDSKRPVWAKGKTPQEIEEYLYKYYKRHINQGGYIDPSGETGQSGLSQRDKKLLGIEDESPVLKPVIEPPQTKPLLEGELRASQESISPSPTTTLPLKKLEGIKSSNLSTSSNLSNVPSDRIAQTTQSPQLPQKIQGSKDPPLQSSTLLQKSQPASSDSILQQAKQEIQKQPDKKQTIRGAWNQFYTDYVNRMQPVEDLTKNVEKSLNVSIRPEYSPKYQIMKLLGAGGTAELRHRKELDPIIKELGNIDKSDFDVFLKANRDVELGQRGIFGSNTELAQQRIQALGQKYDLNKFKEVATKLYDYQDKGLQKLVEAGFIDDATYKTIKGQNEAYVPFQRVMDEVDNYLGLPTKKLSQGKQPISKIVGSERAIQSPLESIIANTYKLEGAISKNNVAKSIANLATINPEFSKIIQKVDKAGASTIPVWENGKKSFYEVPEDINKVVKGLNEEQVGQVVKLLSIPANLLRQGATGRNIDFMVPNIVKDQFDAAVSSKYGYRPFIDYFNGLGEMIKSHYGKPNLYDEYAKSGGKIFYEMAGGRKSIAKELEDATKQKSLGKKFFNTITDGLDFLGKLSETPTRVGLFKRALQGSGNKLIAANEAREGTLDFARMGAKMKVANSIIPFLNVGVQGFDKLIRSAKDNPAKMILYGTMYGIAPQIALTRWNNEVFPEEYKEIGDDVKQDNFVFVTGRSSEGKVQYVSVSKGNILPYITNPVDNMLSAASGFDNQSFSTLMTQLVGDALPLIEPGRDLAQTASRSLGSVIPQAIKPAIENVANFNFYKGKPIVPWYMENKVPTDQAYDSTELPYKYLGNLIQVSPLKVKNILEGYLSGFVKTPLQLASIMQKVSRGEAPSRNEIPVLRRFIAETYDNQEQFQEKQQKEQDRISDKEEQQSQIAPLEKRLFGEVSAAEKADLKSREKLKKSKETKLKENGKVFTKKDTESGVRIDTIDPDFQPSPPKFTGKDELDKQMREKFNGEVTQKRNDIYKLFSEGEYTQDQANTELEKLKVLQDKYSAPKKEKKASKKKITGVKFDFNLKSRTTKPFKFKRPTVRTAPVNLLPKSNLKALTFKGKPLKFKK